MFWFDFKFFRHGSHVNLRIDLQWAVLKYCNTYKNKSNWKKCKAWQFLLKPPTEKKLAVFILFRGVEGCCMFPRNFLAPCRMVKTIHCNKLCWYTTKLYWTQNIGNVSIYHIFWTKLSGISFLKQMWKAQQGILLKSVSPFLIAHFPLCFSAPFSSSECTPLFYFTSFVPWL